MTKNNKNTVLTICLQENYNVDFGAILKEVSSLKLFDLRLRFHVSEPFYQTETKFTKKRPEMQAT